MTAAEPGPRGRVIVERRGAVMILTLDNPDRMNALSGAMMTQLGEAFDASRDDPSIRAIVVTGQGKAFCSGADVESLKGMTGLPAASEETRPMPRFTPRHCKTYKPTICAVNGMCASAGLHFVADCDIVIASDRAQFTDTHVNVGQVSAIEPIGLARRAPLGTVLRLVILGKAERLNAEQALATHLISEIVPHDSLMERAMELAQQAAKVSPAAVQASLKAVWESFEHPLEEAYERGWRDLVRHRQHPDAAEGPRAFAEKRDPNWADG